MVDWHRGSVRQSIHLPLQQSLCPMVVANYAYWPKKTSSLLPQSVPPAETSPSLQTSPPQATIPQHCPRTDTVQKIATLLNQVTYVHFLLIFFPNILLYAMQKPISFINGDRIEKRPCWNWFLLPAGQGGIELLLNQSKAI